MDEKPVATARASVMLFDTNSNSWISSGSNPGISKVQLFRHQINNTYRVVGWKLNDKEVVLNCAIFRGLKYNQARQTFHQWRDAKHQVYGLNFTNKEEAEQFASAILEALESLNQIYNQGQDIVSQQQIDIQHVSKLQLGPEMSPVTHPLSSQSQSTINNYQSQNCGISSMPEYALPQKQLKEITVGSLNNIRDNCTYTTQISNISNTSDEVRRSQQEMQKFSQNPSSSVPSPSPSPGPAPPSSAPPLPPGPPPLTSLPMARPQNQQSSNDSDDESGRSALASQLRQAKLKSRIGQVETDSLNQNKSLPAAATLGRTGGDSMMSEMQRVLAARKKAKEVVKPDDIECDVNSVNGDNSAKNGQWSLNHYRSQNDFDLNNGPPTGNQLKSLLVDAVKTNPIQSATLGRKISLQQDNQQQSMILTRQDLDNFKTEILQEVRIMINQFKADIVNVIRSSKS